MAPKLAVAAFAAVTLAWLADPGVGAAERWRLAGQQVPGDAGRWSVSDIQPLGQPLAVGSAIIGYGRRDQRVHLQGRSPSTGTLLWEAEAIPDVPVGVAGKVVYREPQPDFGDGYASLVVADPLTGVQIQRSPAMIFAGAPQGCFAGRAVCVSATPVAGQPWHGYRLDLTSGAFIPAGEGISGEGLIRIGPEVALVRDAAVLWRRPDPGAARWTRVAPVAQTVPRAGPAPASSPAPTAGPAPAASPPPTVSPAPTASPAPAAAVWVGETATGSVGLAESDGALLWTQAGAVSDCGLPVRAVPVRCRGGLIEGFDAYTGKALWSVPINGPIAVAGNSAIVVAGVAVSLSTGERRPAAGPFWCLTGTGKAAGPAGTARPAGAAGWSGTVEVCGGAGLPPVPAWAAVGAVAQGYAVVATPTGYSGISADSTP